MFGTRRIFIFLTVSLADCRPNCNVSTTFSYPVSLSRSFSLSCSLVLPFWHPLPLGSVLHNQFLINSNHPASHKYRIRLLLCARFMCLWRVAAAIWTFLIWTFLLGASIALSTLFQLTSTLLPLSMFPFSLLPANFVFGGQDKEPNHALATVSSQTALCLCHCLAAKKYASPCERVCNHIHNNNHHHTHRQTRTLLPLPLAASWFMRCWQLSKFNYKAALWGAQNERKIDKQWKLNCTFCSASQGLAGFACWQPAKGSVTAAARECVCVCGGCTFDWWCHLAPP